MFQPASGESVKKNINRKFIFFSFQYLCKGWYLYISLNSISFFLYTFLDILTDTLL